MNTENDKRITPKRTKRLGLARSSSMQKSASSLTRSSVKWRKLDIETPISTPLSRFSQSDIKMNYKGLERKPSSKNTDGGNTLTTPENTSSAGLHTLAVSTNCRPYRLALSKKVREKMTKKRLEFYLANEVEKEETKEKQMESEHHQNFETVNVFKAGGELLDEINSDQKELTARHSHLRKVEELKQAIFIWKIGFSAALHDLQQKIEPRPETAALLERLNIPQKMIKYIDE